MFSDGTPPTAANLDNLTAASHLAEPLIDPRTAHLGCAHQIGNRDAVLGSEGERGPQKHLRAASHLSRDMTYSPVGRWLTNLWRTLLLPVRAFV